jgi:putative membrane protein
MDQQDEKKVPSKDLGTELAKERTSAAYDRTLMAWVRTALSLIGFGIGIFEFTQKTGGQTVFKSSKLVGLSLVLLGIVAAFMAIQENRVNHKRLLQPEITYTGESRLSTGVGYALIVIGIAAIIHIVVKIIQTGI